jgi:hypothetical protein
MLARATRLIALAGVFGGVVAESAAAQDQKAAQQPNQPAAAAAAPADADVSEAARVYKFEKPEIREVTIADPLPADVNYSSDFGGSDPVAGAVQRPAHQPKVSIVKAPSPRPTKFLIRQRCEQVIGEEFRNKRLALDHVDTIYVGGGLPPGDNPADVPSRAGSTADEWDVAFHLSYQGIPFSSTSSVVVSVSGNQFTIDKRNVPEEAQFPDDREIKANEKRMEAFRLPPPWLVPFEKAVASTAIEVAQEDLRRRTQPVRPSGQANVEPQPREAPIVLVHDEVWLEIWLPPSGCRGRLVYRFTLVSGDTTARYPETVYWVEAFPQTAGAKPRILQRSDRAVRFQGGSVEIQAKGNYWLRSSPLAPDLKQGMPLGGVTFQIKNAAGQVVEEGVIQRNGKYTLDPHPGSQLVARLENDQCVVWQGTVNVAALMPVVDAPAKAGDRTIISFCSMKDAEIAQVTAFRWTNEAFAFYKGILPDPSRAIPKANVIVNDSIDSGYQRYGDEIHLSQDVHDHHRLWLNLNAACADVIFHEYAHMIDEKTAANNRALGATHPLSKAYQEGFADAFAILYKKQDFVGEDLLGEGKHARDYRTRKYTMTRDGNPQPGELEYVDYLSEQRAQELNQQVLSHYQTSFGDGPEHFRGRIYALFVSDLVRRISGVDGYPGVDGYKNRELAYRLVRVLVFRAGLNTKGTIRDAVFRIKRFIDSQKGKSISDKTHRALVAQVEAAAADLKIPPP